MQTNEQGVISERMPATLRVNNQTDGPCLVAVGSLGTCAGDLPRVAAVRRTSPHQGRVATAHLRS